MNPAESQDAIFGQPLNLPTMLAIQDQAIVSRILVKHPGGSITLFAFAAGQSLEEHTAPFDAMIYVLEGTAEVSVAGNWHRLETGKAILMPANIPHAVRAPEAFKMLLVMLRKA